MNGRKVLLFASSILFIALVAAGFKAVGSPSTARRIDSDRNRVERLNSLHFELQAFYKRTGDLPKSIEELMWREHYVARYDPLRDPESGTLFAYELVGDTTYRVCAVFQSDSDEDRSGYDVAEPGVYDHPKGRHCFTREVIKEDVPPQRGLPPKYP